MDIDNSTTTALFVLSGFILLLSKVVNSFSIGSYKCASSSKNSSAALAGLQTFARALPVATDITKVLPFLNQFITNYGPLPRIKFLHKSFVFLSKFEDVRLLLSSRRDELLHKPSFLYDIALAGIDGPGLGLPSLPVQPWKIHRKILSMGFTYKSLTYYNDAIFNKYAKKLVKHLENLNKENSITPLASELRICTLNIICQTVSGLNADVDQELAYKICENINILMGVIAKRMRHWWTAINFLWKFDPSYYESRRATKYLDQSFKIMVDRCRENRNLCNGAKSEVNENEGEVSEESCKSLLELMECAGMSEKEIIHETKTLVIVGYETTSVTTEFLLFMLALHQEHQEICREEVDAVFRNKNDCSISYSDIVAGLKHLEKCLLETMRLFPGVPLFGRELHEDLVLGNGTVIKSGETALVYSPIIHKNPEYFPYPEQFDPERFTAENIKRRDPYKFMPFSLGPRNCIGYKFAMAEIKTVVAHVLHNFEIYTTDKYDDIPLIYTGILRPAREYNFVLKKRQHK